MDRDGWNDRYRTKELVWTATPNQFVVAEVADLAPGRAIDVAAGEARNAVWLAEQGWEATAVDYSDVAVAKAGELAAARGVTITTAVVDVVHEPLPGGPYELVLLAYLQLPEPDRSAALAHAVAAVAPGGTLLAVAHDASNLPGPSGPGGYGGPQDPAVLATPADVVAHLDGLRVLKAEVVERRVDTAEGERIAYDHVVRAVRP
jgi:SAM-dependent methyltransferase